MVIKETSVFTRQVSKLLDVESYRLLQLLIAADPEAGDLIRGTSGLRKIRWQGSGRGKRGGVRVIYLLGCESRRRSDAADVWEERAR